MSLFFHRLATFFSVGLVLCFPLPSCFRPQYRLRSLHTTPSPAPQLFSSLSFGIPLSKNSHQSPHLPRRSRASLDPKATQDTVASGKRTGAADVGRRGSPWSVDQAVSAAAAQAAPGPAPPCSAPRLKRRLGAGSHLWKPITGHRCSSFTNRHQQRVEGWSFIGQGRNSELEQCGRGPANLQTMGVGQR